MTEVTFHVNVPDPVAYACRLLRKAYLRGSTMLVLGETEQIAALDGQLWAMRPVDFVPHCCGADLGEVFMRSPVVLIDDMAKIPHRSFVALLNLTKQVPAGYSDFARLFEVVSLSETDRLVARTRWKAYQADGLAPKLHTAAS